MSSDSLDKKSKNIESFNIWCAASTHFRRGVLFKYHKYLSKEIKFINYNYP